MKRSFTYLLACIVLFAVVISCSKSSDPAAPSVVGTWKFTSAAATGCTDGSDNYSETCGGSVADCGMLVLTANTYTYTPPTGSGSPETGTYTISGSTLVSTTGGVAKPAQTFVVTATTLTFSEHESPSAGCTSTTVFTRQ